MADSQGKSLRFKHGTSDVLSFWLRNITRQNQQETLAQLLRYKHGEMQVET